ncbi:unnamed protein product [Haemonchus placei]|uniref:Uncharacterized protein n=1 Tax=Haemonchus placei TaxID=6290 RepID=A0A3P8AAF6_HAEPC|nr:unnamed protein product [Haemonchus placei]
MATQCYVLLSELHITSEWKYLYFCKVVIQRSNYCMWSYTGPSLPPSSPFLSFRFLPSAFAMSLWFLLFSKTQPTVLVAFRVGNIMFTIDMIIHWHSFPVALLLCHDNFFTIDRA